MKGLFKQKRVWIPAVVLLLVLLYAAGGFLLAPHLLRNGLIKGIHDQFGLDARVGEVRINPFLLQLDVRNFALPDRDGAPLLGFARLFVDFEVASLWHRAYVFKDIDIEGPFANAKIARNGRLNFDALKPRVPPDEGKAPQPAAPANQGSALPRIEIAAFRLDRGAASFQDLSRADPIDLHVDPITFELHDFTTGAEGGRFTFSGTSRNDERLEWHGHFALQPLSSDGEFRITGLKAHGLWEYIKHQVAFVVPSGSIDLGGSYRFLMRDRPEFEARLSGLDLRDLSLGPTEGEADWLRLSRLSVGPVQLSLIRRSVSVDSLLLDGLKVQAWVEPDHSLNWQRLARRPAIPGASTEPAAASLASREQHPGDIDASPVASKGEELSSVNSGSWNILLKRFSVKDASLDLQDRSLQPVVDLAVAPLNATVSNISQDLGRPLEVKFEARINRSARLSLAGNVVPSPLKADTEVELTALPLEIAQPYLAQRTALILRSGDLGVKGHVQVQMPAAGAPKPAPLALAFKGDVSVDRLHTVDSQRDEDLLKWARVQVRGINASLGPDRLDIDRVILAKPYVRVAIAPDRTLNVTRALAEPGGAPPATAAASTPMVKPARAAHISRRANAGKPVLAQASRPVAPPAQTSMPILIRKVIVQDGTLNFSDQSLTPNFAASINALDGSIEGLSSRPGTRAKIDLKGQVDRFSPVTIQGEANVLGPLYTDIAMNFRNMELTTFNPYSGKFAGYDIAKGKLTTELTYRIDGRKLDAGHHIIIDQLEFGAKTDSKDAVSLPIKLAVALLKDRNGVIDLDVPVTGSLDDPHFRLGPVIWKVVRNLLVKIVTAPFALLGKLFGGGPDLQFVDFPAGLPTLDEVAQNRIRSVAKALAERPQLRIAVPLATVTALDRPALVQARYQSLLLEQQRQEMPRSKAAEAQTPPGFDTLSPKQQLALLSAAYRKLTGSAPRFPEPASPEGGEQSRKQAREQQLEQDIAFVHEGLLKAIQVPDQELSDLAKARAAAIQQILLGGKQIDPARVFLVVNDKAAAQDKTVRLELTLQ